MRNFLIALGVISGVAATGVVAMCTYVHFDIKHRDKELDNASVPQKHRKRFDELKALWLKSRDVKIHQAAMSLTTKLSEAA